MDLSNTSMSCGLAIAAEASLRLPVNSTSSVEPGAKLMVDICFAIVSYYNSYCFLESEVSESGDFGETTGGPATPKTSTSTSKIANSA